MAKILTDPNKYTKTNEMVSVGGQESYVFNKGADQYVTYDTGKSTMQLKVNTDKYGFKSVTYNNKSIPVVSKVNSKPTNTNTNTNTATNTNNVNSSDVYNNAYQAAYNSIMSRYQEPEKPKTYTSAEVAKILGLDYDYNKALEMYNKETNDAYDAYIKEQENARGQYANSVLSNINDVVNNYLNSYKNAAPTATGKATIGANALSTMLGGYYVNNQNDYELMQSVNNLEKQRATELASNAARARQYYDDLGLKLASIGANYNTAETDKYSSDVKALTTRYGADRSYAASLAEAARNKYSGLAQAAAANNSVQYQDLYNYYRSIGQNAQQASASVNTVASINSGKSAYLK